VFSEGIIIYSKGVGAGHWDAPVASLDNMAAGGHAQRRRLAGICCAGPRMRGHPGHTPAASHHPIFGRTTYPIRNRQFVSIPKRDPYDMLHAVS